MKYSNLQILSELKNIDNCIKISCQVPENNTEKLCKCIYRDDSVWIINYLIENKLVNQNTMHDWNIIPFINSYWRDFLKKWWINCFAEDYKDIILIVIWIIITILTWIIVDKIK